MQLISVYETFLYYCCLLIVSRYVFGYVPKKHIMYLSFVVFVPLTFAARYLDPLWYGCLYLLFAVLQFFLLKWIFNHVRIGILSFFYVLIFCINVIGINLISLIFPTCFLEIDVVFNTVSTVVFVLLCAGTTRMKIRSVIEWIPKYLLWIMTFLLIATTALSALFLGDTATTHRDAWERLQQISLLLLQLSICIVLPTLILNAISNSRLKSLTENYEQQIYAQAEHYKNLAAANLELRRFKHDFQNTRIAIEKLLADGDHAQALALMQQCSNAMERPGGLALTFDTGNGIADALLTDKQEKATACDTHIVFKGVITPNYLSPTDLCVILGNTLDNAIEACEKVETAADKIIQVNCNCSNGFLFLSVCNPIGEKVVIRDNHIATTKENKTLHGFGLYSLQSVVKRYDGEVKLSSTEDTFTVKIALCLTSVKEPTIQHAN